jgi:hypothetical protein
LLRHASRQESEEEALRQFDFDVVLERTRAELILDDTGNAPADFRAQIHTLATLLRRREGAAFAAMIGGARIDPAIGKAIALRWVTPRKRWGVSRHRVPWDLPRRRIGCLKRDSPYGRTRRGPVTSLRLNPPMGALR